MKLCESCRYRNNTEYEKPCVVYRDDCEHYENERDEMTADLISLEDAIEAIASVDITDGTEPVFSGKQVIALLKDLDTITPQESKWIPISERLPDKYDKYLVTKTTRDAEIEKGYHRFTHIEVMMYSKYSHWGLKTCGVVAWMPLPEPYKAESEIEK